VGGEGGLPLASSSSASATARGVLPVIVQVGNEINNGMLWATASGGGNASCAAGGSLEGPCAASNWPAFASLVGAGIAAVRAFAANASAAPLVMIHTALGPSLGTPGGVA
jgi:arabinogalactan endo-1,4-beta-galactosidase